VLAASARFCFYLSLSPDFSLLIDYFQTGEYKKWVEPNMTLLAIKAAFMRGTKVRSRNKAMLFLVSSDLARETGTNLYFIDFVWRRVTGGNSRRELWLQYHIGSTV
jgi:hypothetical protein